MVRVIEKPKPPYRGTRLRSYRCDDELYDEAMATAQANGDDLSAIVREALADYVRRHRPGQK